MTFHIKVSKVFRRIKLDLVQLITLTLYTISMTNDSICQQYITIRLTQSVLSLFTTNVQNFMKLIQALIVAFLMKVRVHIYIFRPGKRAEKVFV